MDAGNARFDGFSDRGLGPDVGGSVGEEDEEVGSVLTVSPTLDEQFLPGHLDGVGDVRSASSVRSGSQGL